MFSPFSVSHQHVRCLDADDILAGDDNREITFKTLMRFKHMVSSSQPGESYLLLAPRLPFEPEYLLTIGCYRGWSR